MQFDVNPFLSGHPEVQELIKKLEKENAHFAKLLAKYYELAHEIGRAESDDVPGEAMEDLAMEQKKKERLALKDELIVMLKEAGADL